MTDHELREICWALVEIFDDMRTPGETFADVIGDDDIHNIQDAFDWLLHDVCANGFDSILRGLDEMSDERDWFGRKCIALAQFIRDTM